MSTVTSKPHNRRRSIGSRIFIVVTAALMTVSPSGVSVLAADEPALGDNGTVSGVVWVDADADGVRDDGEEGLGGHTMVLTGDSTGSVATAPTDDGGAYELSGAPAGDYRVEVLIPDGYEVAPVPDGGDGAMNAFTAVGGTAESDGFAYGPGTDIELSLGLVPVDDGDGEEDAPEPTTTTTAPETTTTTAAPETTTTTAAPETTTTTTAPETTTTTTEDDPAPDDDAPLISLLSVSPADTYIGDMTFYAYAEAGETIDLAFTKNWTTSENQEGTVVTVTDPDGATASCEITAPAEDGDTCVLADLTSASSGVWEIVNVIGPGSAANRYTWQIDVSDGGGVIDGRVWAEEYAMRQLQTDPLADLTFWYQTEHGYTYEATYGGFNGINSTFMADATGVAFNSTCTSAYASIVLTDQAGETPDPDRYVPDLGECGDPYKIFFEEPAADLPATADRWDGGTDWIVPPIEVPEITSVTFTPDSTTVRSGTIDYEVDNFTGQLVVEVDTDDDGVFDVVIPGSAVGGTGSVSFDGLDDGGDPVSPLQDIAVRVSIDQTGEIHFVNTDVEVRSGGIEVVRLNGPASGDSTLYWDDTDLSTAGRCGNWTATLDGTAGVASGGGVHEWDVSGCAGIANGWGDARAIDDWTYVQVDETMAIEVPGEDLPAFVCDASAYLFQGAPTSVTGVNLVTGEDTELATDIHTENINAVGYNPADDYIYGFVPSGIVRVGSDFTVDELGLPSNWGDYPFLPDDFQVGEFDAAGTYWVMSGSYVDSTVPWAQIDLRPGSETFMEVLQAGQAAEPVGTGGNFDWGYNPIDGDLYAVAGFQGSDDRRLWRFNTDDGTFTGLGALGFFGDSGAAFGAVYTDPAGYLYASNNGSGEIFRINLDGSNDVQLFADGPASNSNDGARCFNAPLPIDFGDAPASHGTLLEDDGPRHAVPDYDTVANTADVMLGSSIDIEIDGQPTAAADGDDTSTGDEDGVAFNPSLGYPDPTLRTGLDPVSLQPVENTLEVEASDDGFVSVWVDWNQDGDFDDAGEQVANAEPVSAGLNDITFSQGTNPDDISAYVRVRYSTDEGSIATPYGPAPDGEVEDYQVLVERLNQPDACVDAGEEYYSFTFNNLVDLVGDGTVPSSGLYTDVTAINGVAVDMFVEVVAGSLSDTNFPPNGLLVGGVDDATWSVENDATLAYRFYEAGTTNPIAINGVFTVNDVDDIESATFSADDLASYAVTQGSAVTITESGGDVTFDGNGNWSGDPESRFQIVLEGISTFEARWQGSANAGFAFDGDKDLSIQPPACEDWGDAPDSYDTTAAENGPNHTIVPGLFMGAEIDFDTDGQPTADADGDDTNRTADEDGVTDPIELTAGEQTTVDVTVTNTTGEDAILAGWIDLDETGTFDVDELQTVAVPDGTIGATVELTFDAPAGFGDTFARFRLFPDDGTTPISPTGPASAGEVEDFAVTGAVQQQWSCPSDGLLFQYPDGTPTEVQFVDLVTGEVDLGELEIEDRGVNAAAYNISDDYVYGWDHQTDPDSGERVGIVRIGPDGSVDVLGVPNHPQLDPTWGFPVGDVDSSGHYWVASSTGSGANARWFQIDLNPGLTFMTVLATGLVGDGDASGYAGSGDWAWVPNHDAVYRVMREIGTNQWSLFRFDRTSGEHQRLGALPTMNGYSGTFGAAYADPDYLYVSHNLSGDIFRIDIDVVSAELFVEDGPPSGTNDAARCATAPIPIDFGDAPDADYDTLLASDGARHGVPGYVAADNEAPLMLGPSIDIESDGFPSPGADGDDNDPVDDEDGVTTPVVLSTGGATDVTVSVTNDTGDDATLAGWIDLNGDGDFADAGERVVEPVTASGDYDLNFPAATATDTTYARFRLYPGDAADPQPTGAASAGEVEDYLVEVSGLEIAKTANPASGTDVSPGDTVTYTITLSNPGTTDQIDVEAADDLSDVLDDADLISGPQVTPAGAGAADIIGDDLSFTGDVPAGEDVTISYMVEVLDPSESGGDGLLANAVSSPDTGNCPAPAITDPQDPDFDPDCVTQNPVRDVEIVKSSVPADGSAVAPGDTVTYTLEITNRGGYGYTAGDPVEVTDDLSGVVDDAAYNNDADDDGHAGTFGYTAPELTWTGPLAPDEVVEVTYTVTVLDAENLGDAILENVVTGTDSGCPDPAITDPQDPDYDPDCHNVVEVGAVQYEKTVDPPDPLALQPGDSYTYTVTATNVGATDLTGLSFTDDLSEVLDDASFGPDPVMFDLGTAAFDAVDEEVTWNGDLDVEGVATVTYQVTIDDPILGDSLLINGVVGDGPGSNCPPPGPSTDPDCFKQIPQPLIETVKSSDVVGNVEPGDTVEYEFTVSNDGTGPAYAFEVTDDLAGVLDDATYEGDVALESGPGSVVYDAVNQEIVWTGPLDVDESATVTYSVTVNDATDLGDGELLNAITSPDCFDPPITDPDHADFDPDCVNIENVEAWTAIKTSDAAGNVEPGDEVTYTITVENTGNVDLTNAPFPAVIDDLSEVLDDASYNGDVSTVGPGTATFLPSPEVNWVGPLLVDEVATITYSVTVNDADDLDDGRLQNAVAGSSNCPDPAETDPQNPDFDPDCVTINDIEAWTAVKSSDASDPVQPGDTITYTIEVENTGNVPLTAVTVDDLSEVLDDASYDGNADDSGHAGIFDFTDPALTWTGDLAVDETATLTYSVAVNDADDLGDGELLNAITGSSNCPDPAETDPQHPDFDPDCVNIEDVEAWTVSKSSDASDPVRPGDTVAYTIEVENTGNVDLSASDVLVEDDLTEVLDDAAYNNDADQGATYGEPVVSWSDDLGVDEVVTITYSVTVNDADDLDDGRLLNAVTGGDCPNPAETDPQDPDFDPECVTVDDVAAYTVVKTSSGPSPVLPGDTVSYTITVENSGNVAIDSSDVLVEDDLTDVLDDADYNNDADQGAIYGEPFLSWSDDLGVDEVVTITYSVTVNDATDLGDGRLLNAVTGGDCPNPAETDPQDPDFDPDCVTVEDVEAWTVSKSSDASDPVLPGDTITYTIVVENTGNVDLAAAEVVVEDDLTEVLDDASYNNDVDQGATYSAQVINWSDDLEVDGVVTITYSVTVNDADDLDDGRLRNAVTGGDCPDPAEPDPLDPDFDPECVTIDDVAAYTVVKTSSGPNPVLPGDTVSYEITVENTGNVDLTGPDAATVSDDLSDVLDDATFDGNENADIGTAIFSDPVVDWSGDLFVDDEATITYSVTVDQPIAGDHDLVNAVTGGDCSDPAVTDPQAAGFDPDCVDIQRLPGVDINKVIFGDPGALEPGDSFEYVVTVENIGQVDLVGESFTDDLTEVLDDATLDQGSMSADIGTVTFSSPEITWVGDLAVGVTAEIRYTVDIDEPLTGDGELVNVVVGSEYSNCVPPDADDPGCWEETPISNVVVSKELVGPVEPQPGDDVTYRLTAENRGGADAIGEEITDDLSGVLDDATYNEDATATSGSTNYTEPELSWNGDIGVGETVEVTYTVMVNGHGELGDAVLENAVTGGENCPGDECETTTSLPTYEATKEMVSSAEPEAGDVVTYQIDVVNTGPVLVEDAVVGDDLSGLLDDAVYNGDATAGSGGFAYSEPELTWTGPLAVGEIVTITYSVTVNDGSDLGDGELENVIVAPNCGDVPNLPTLADDSCATLSQVRSVEYSKTIVSPNGHISAGDTVTYQVTATNTGAAHLSGISFTDDLSDVLEHAIYEDDATATTGTVSYASNVLTWTGDLASGESATVTYTIRLDDEAPRGATLDNVVVGDGPGTNCTAGSDNEDCLTTMLLSTSDLPFTGLNLIMLLAAGVLLVIFGGSGLSLGRISRWNEADDEA